MADLIARGMAGKALKEIDGLTPGGALTLSAGDGIAISTTSGVSTISVEEPLPTTSAASVGDVLTLDRDGEPYWATPSTPSEIEFESTHSAGEDYVVTKMSGDDSVEVRAKVYDNGDYINGDYSYMGAGDLGASDDNGDNRISIGAEMITFTTLDSNDDPIDGSLSMSADGELQWNGSSIIPTYTSSDAGNVLSVNSLGDGIEWMPASGGGSGARLITFQRTLSNMAADDITFLEEMYANGGVMSEPAIFIEPYTSSYDYRGRQYIYYDYKAASGINAGSLRFGCLGKTNSDTTFRGVRTITCSFDSSGTLFEVSFHTFYTPLVSKASNATSRLTIYNGIVNLTDELPSISSGDAGKVLAVNSGETGVEWITASGGSPACPTTTDGTYMLQCVVSSGTATYSWNAVTTASGNNF